MPGRRLRDPIGVSASDDGQLLVADEGVDLTLRFDATGGLVANGASEDVRLPWWGTRQDRLRAHPTSNVPPRKLERPHDF